MTRRRLLAGVLPALMAVSGCLASKGDIRLLQEEVRTSRSASASSDAAQRAQADSLAKASDRATAAAFARLDATIRAQADTLRALRRMVDANQTNEHDFQIKVTDWERDMTQQMGEGAGAGRDVSQHWQEHEGDLGGLPGPDRFAAGPPARWAARFDRSFGR